MNYSAPQALLFLLTGISLIVILTAKFRLHAFFPILIAAWVVGLGVHMPVADILNDLKEGFGGVMRSLGLIVVLGTVLGILLEYTGSSRIMADFILQKVGERHAALGISITGFIIGLPIFCDAGFIVLSGLTHSFSKRTSLKSNYLGVRHQRRRYAQNRLSAGRHFPQTLIHYFSCVGIRRRSRLSS